MNRLEHYEKIGATREQSLILSTIQSALATENFNVVKDKPDNYFSIIANAFYRVRFSNGKVIVAGHRTSAPMEIRWMLRGNFSDDLVRAVVDANELDK